MDGDSSGRWLRAGTRYLFESHWFSLRQDHLVLPGGHEITYTFVEHPGYVMVVPLLADGRVVMERIYRHTLQRVDLECPSGGLDGEAPEVAARRELEEETGYLAGRLRLLGKFAGSSGISTEEHDLFLATELSPMGAIRREPAEEMEIELVSLRDLHAMVLAGQIRNGPSALAILLAAQTEL